MGQREKEYNSPENSFASIAALWSAYKGTDFTPTDVAMMMSLLKIARIRTGTATEDSFVDLAGYAACGCEIASEKKNPSQLSGVGLQTFQVKHQFMGRTLTPSRELREAEWQMVGGYLEEFARTGRLTTGDKIHIPSLGVDVELV